MYVCIQTKFLLIATMLAALGNFCKPYLVLIFSTNSLKISMSFLRCLCLWDILLNLNRFSGTPCPQLSVKRQDSFRAESS